MEQNLHPAPPCGSARHRGRDRFHSAWAALVFDNETALFFDNETALVFDNYEKKISF